MTYDAVEASTAEGRPYYLYQFIEGEQIWRFTSRASDWISAASEGGDLVWEAAAISHGDVVQSSDIERGRLEITLPLSHAFAARFLAPRRSVVLFDRCAGLFEVGSSIPLLAHPGLAKVLDAFGLAIDRR